MAFPKRGPKQLSPLITVDLPKDRDVDLGTLTARIYVASTYIRDKFLGLPASVTLKHGDFFLEEPKEIMLSYFTNASSAGTWLQKYFTVGSFENPVNKRRLVMDGFTTLDYVSDNPVSEYFFNPWLTQVERDAQEFFDDPRWILKLHNMAIRKWVGGRHV